MQSRYSSQRRRSRTLFEPTHTTHCPYSPESSYNQPKLAQGQTKKGWCSHCWKIIIVICHMILATNRAHIGLVACWNLGEGRHHAGRPPRHRLMSRHYSTLPGPSSQHSPLANVKKSTQAEKAKALIRSSDLDPIEHVIINTFFIDRAYDPEIAAAEVLHRIAEHGDGGREVLVRQLKNEWQNAMRIGLCASCLVQYKYVWSDGNRSPARSLHKGYSLRFSDAPRQRPLLHQPPSLQAAQRSYSALSHIARH